MLLFLLYYYFVGTNYFLLQIIVSGGDRKRIMERTIWFVMFYFYIIWEICQEVPSLDGFFFQASNPSTTTALVLIVQK